MQTMAAPVIQVSCTPGACTVPWRTYYTLVWRLQHVCCMPSFRSCTNHSPALALLMHVGRH